MKKQAKIFLMALLVLTPEQKELFTTPEGWPPPIYNFSNNKLIPEKIRLGRFLFYDPILSENNSISCANCHSPYNAFAHSDHQLSHGIKDQIGDRNAPILINLAWHSSFMMDGAIHNLDVQALAPITHPKEMGSSINEVVRKLNQPIEYKEMFLQAYGDTLITGERILKAISQFLLTLNSYNSYYDKVTMTHDAVFKPNEENGYNLFKKYCNSCHTEPLFTNNSFETNGLPVDVTLKDYGRMRITKNAKDSLKFKVPTLRNLQFTSPYMHDGRFRTLNQVLDHYIIKQNIPLTLTEKQDIISFLMTLTDWKFIGDTSHLDPIRIRFIDTNKVSKHHK